MSPSKGEVVTKHNAIRGEGNIHTSAMSICSHSSCIPRADEISGGRGNDILTGDLRGDSLHGGAGDDILEGGPGADRIDSGRGGQAHPGTRSRRVRRPRWVSGPLRRARRLYLPPRARQVVGALQPLDTQDRSIRVLNRQMVIDGDIGSPVRSANAVFGLRGDEQRKNVTIS